MKGEVHFEAGGKSHSLRFTTAAFCELEEQLDMGVAAIATRLQDPETLRLSFLRMLFWAGMLHEDDPEITVEKTGEMMDELGLPEVSTLIGQAFTAAFGTEAAKGGKGPRLAARAARAGTS